MKLIIFIFLENIQIKIIKKMNKYKKIKKISEGAFGTVYQY